MRPLAILGGCTGLSGSLLVPRVLLQVYSFAGSIRSLYSCLRMCTFGMLSLTSQSEKLKKNKKAKWFTTDIRNQENMKTFSFPFNWTGLVKKANYGRHLLFFITEYSFEYGPLTTVM